MGVLGDGAPPPPACEWIVLTLIHYAAVSSPGLSALRGHVADLNINLAVLTPGDARAHNQDLLTPLVARGKSYDVFVKLTRKLG